MRIQVLKLITLLFVFAFSSHAFATITVFWDGTGDGNPDTSIPLPAPGDQPFTIDLYADISDDGHGGLLSWGGLAQFSASAATATNSTIDPNWFVVGKNDISPGVVDLVAGRIGSGLSGQQLLASIQFTATGPFVLSLVDHGPGFDDFVAEDGFVYDGSFGEPTIQVVPIPGAVLFMLTGLAGLIGFNRRKSS